MGTLVAIPNTGDIKTDLVERLFEFHDIDDCDVFFSEAQPVDINRNKIVKHFLEETEHEWLLMIDSDIIPPPAEDVLSMQEYDADIVSPIAFSMRDGVPYPVAAVDDTETLRMHFAGNEDKEVVEVDAIGTGCIMIRREVFEGLEQPYFKFRYNEDGCSINTGEDLDFTLRATEAGFTVAMSSNFVADHLTTVSLASIMQSMNLAFQSDESNIYTEVG